MNWIPLNDKDQIDLIIKESFQIPCIIYKHSTTCSISSIAKYRLEQDWEKHLPYTLYFLDIWNYRSISNDIADQFQVYHESPQVLVIKDGTCIYDSSHLDIQALDILEEINR